MMLLIDMIESLEQVLADNSQSPREAKLTVYQLTENIPQEILDLAEEEDIEIERVPVNSNEASLEASQQMIESIKTSILDDLVDVEDDEYNVHMRLIVVDPDRQDFFHRHLLQSQRRPKVYAVPVSRTGEFGTTELNMPINSGDQTASLEAVTWCLFDKESIRKELNILRTSARHRRALANA